MFSPLARTCAVRGSVVALVAAGLLLASPAWADTAGPGPDSGDGDEKGPCTVEDQCPDSGVRCEDSACYEQAEADGLSLRCEGETFSVYCDPDETSGCATSVPPRRPELHFAVAAFVVAAAASVVRARRRGSRRADA